MSHPSSRPGSPRLLRILAVPLAAALLLGTCPRLMQAAPEDDALIFTLLQQAVADREPDGGPQAGEIGAAPDGPALGDPLFSASDFAIRFTCAPAGPEGNCGIVFRGDPENGGLFLAIGRDGSWQYGPAGGEPVQTGQLADRASLEDGQIPIELFAIGAYGYAGVGGRYLATLDLSGRLQVGAAVVGTGLAGGEAGADYADLTFWLLDDETDPPSERPDDPAAQFSYLLEVIGGSDPVAGPAEGLLIHREGQATFSRSGIDLADFAAHLACEPPGIEPPGAWDCGIVFRLGEAVDEQLRLILLSTGRWILAQGTAVTVQEGAFDPAGGDPEGAVTIDLIAIGEQGWLGINGVFAGLLNLALQTAPGDVAAGTAFFQSTNVAGSGTTFRAFTIWEVDPASVEPVLGAQAAGTPVAGGGAARSDAALAAILWRSIASTAPSFETSGEMAHDPGAITLVASGIRAARLAVRLACIAPDDAGTRLWDCGILWGPGEGTARSRVVVVSDGFWSIRAREGAPVLEGAGLLVDNEPGSRLVLDLLVLGETGFFLAGGELVARLDLPPAAAGEPLAGTAFFNETYAGGGVTAYASFAVWALELPSAATVAPEETAPATAESEPPGSGEDLAGTPGPLAGVVPQEAPQLAIAQIEPAEGSSVQGYGVVTRVARDVDVVVLIAGAGAGDVVVVQAGSCGRLDAGAVEPVGAIDERGVASATLAIRLTELLSLGEHALVVYADTDAEFRAPIACGVLRAA